MTDFFARIFAVPSEYDDDESYSADDTYSQSSSVRRRSRIKNAKQSYHRPNTFASHSDDISDDENTKGIEESSASISYDEDIDDRDKDHRGRQRRNDAPSGHRSASEPRSKQKKKRSSSERPNATTAKQSQQSRYRSARSLSKVPERHHAASLSPNDDNDKKETKNWRSKFSKGIKKKHISFTADSSPAPPSKQPKKISPKNNESRNQHQAKANGNPSSSQPINVGDFITISQQYLEKNEEMSVLTLPKELASKEVDEENLMQIIGQRGVLGNDAVQAFLDRRGVGGGAAASRQGGGENLHIHRSTSVESKGMYERVGSYATKLLDISYSRSQSLENSSTLQEEGVEVPHGQDLLAVANYQIGRHAWPCDPTAEGYSVGENAAHTVITEQEIGSIDMPPPMSPPPFDGIEEHRVQHDMQIPVRDDPSGIHIDTSINVDPLKSTKHCRQIDEAHSRPIESHAPVNKSVSFSLPPPSSLPPAPPFLGPHLDYYYSMERDAKDNAPIWSNTTILPPIIELWSSVEDSSTLGTFGSVWNAEKEKELVGEEEVNLIEKEECVPQSEKALLVGVKTREKFVASKKPTTSPTSPGEKSMEYFHDILDCNGVDLNGVIDCNGNDDDAPADEKEGLKLTTSSLSIKTDPAGSSETEVMLGDDANFRHRSQWKSSHNMTYKPPMFSGEVGRSESSEDSVLKLRRFHEDGISTGMRQESNDDSRPVILPCRVGRQNLSFNTSNPLKSSSITLTRSPSAASYGSSFSYNAKMFAAIIIQKSARGILERQRLMGMSDSVLIIQSVARRFLYRRRYLMQLKLKRSYYPRNWKRKLLE